METELIDILNKIFELYENGAECYESPENNDGYLGRAVMLDDDMFHRIVYLLNEYRP